MKKLLTKIGAWWLKRTIRKSTNQEIYKTSFRYIGKRLSGTIEPWEEVALNMMQEELKSRGL